MATDSARSVHRQYWQLPLFAVGIVCALGAWMRFPPVPESPAERYRQDLGQLKQLLDRKPLDISGIQTLLPVVQSGLEQYPESAPLANYVIGSGYLAVAEAFPLESEHWQKAAECLEKADINHLTDLADQQRFPYRLAKAKTAIGRGDANMIKTLLAVPPGEDADGELRRLLADAHLAQVPPDNKRAAEELSAYLSGPSRIPAPLQAQYKLKLGELQIQLNDSEKGRSRLMDIGPSAPVEVQAKAKLALAKLASSESNWIEAVKLYEAALSLNSLPKTEIANARYQLGVAYLSSKRIPEATAQLEQASQDSGPVGSAAAIKLAELCFRDPTAKGQRNVAVQRLENAMRDVSPGRSFDHPLVSLNQVQATFEEAIQTAMNEGDFATAVRAASAYEVVAPQGRDREKRAAVQAAWAVQLQQQPGQLQQATEKFRAAAADYVKLAETYPTATGQADLLRRAMECYRNASDDENLSKIADQLTKLTGAPADTVAQAWIELGEVQLNKKAYSEGVLLLQKAMTSGTPSAARARVKIAQTYLDLGRAGQRSATTVPAKAEAAGQIEFAVKVLTEMANIPAEGATEQAAQQSALFELGNYQLQQGNLSDAEARLRQFIQSYPSAPLAGQVKLYLGSCLMLQARGDQRGGVPATDAERKLSEAHKLFESLTESGTEFLRTHADIRLANTTLMMKRYDEMPVLCEKLATRYSGKVEELIILGMLCQAYNDMNRPEQVARTRSRMETAYNKLTDADFHNSAEEYTRQYWLREWFKK